MSLELSDKFSLPREAALWTFAVLAIKGAGKTYDAAKIAEQMIKCNIPIVVLDPMGIWWGLRVGVKAEGLPVVIFGGDHADLEIPTVLSKNRQSMIIDEQKLRQATMAILQSGLSVVFDTSKLSLTQQTRAVAIFADELYHKNGPYGVRHVFIEEADEYCPQEPIGEKRESKAAIDQLVRRGGNFNIGVTMITQRAAVLNKNVLSQTGCLIVLRIIWAKDKITIRDWVKNAVKDERELRKLAKWYDSLKELKDGEAWIYHPTPPETFEKIQFGERETLHASREYFLQETWQQKNVTLTDVSQFVARFKQKLEPKPLVHHVKPVVRIDKSMLDQDLVRPERFEQKTDEKTAGRAYGRPGETSTVYHWTKTSGEADTDSTRNETANKQSSTEQTRTTNPQEITDLGKVAVHIPTRQTESEEVRVPNTGAFTRSSRAQQRPALEQASQTDTIVQQAIPQIEIHQYSPVLRLPVEMLDEPTSTLGRICIILKNGPAPGNRNDQWNQKNIIARLLSHAWPIDGVEEAIHQLIRWEILTRGKKYLKFDPERVVIVRESKLLTP